MANIKIRMLVFTGMLLLTMPVYAGYLVYGGVVTTVANTANNSDTFLIKVTGGVNNLCEGQWIQFPAGEAFNSEVHKRAYSTALTALTARMPVTIHNYADNSCTKAVQIQIDFQN